MLRMTPGALLMNAQGQPRADQPGGSTGVGRGVGRGVATPVGVPDAVRVTVYDPLPTPQPGDEPAKTISTIPHVRARTAPDGATNGSFG